MFFIRIKLSLENKNIRQKYDAKFMMLIMEMPEDDHPPDDALLIVKFNIKKNIDFMHPKATSGIFCHHFDHILL